MYVVSYRFVAHTLYPLSIYVRQGAHESTPLSRDLSPLSKRATKLNLPSIIPAPAAARSARRFATLSQVTPRVEYIVYVHSDLYFGFVLCFDKIIVYVFIHVDVT